MTIAMLTDSITNDAISFALAGTIPANKRGSIKKGNPYLKY